ncbi:MAG TPA: nitroreductase family protein [bacterium]|nr:nitroreductase family protein [bacterium]
MALKLLSWIIGGVMMAGTLGFAEERMQPVQLPAPDMVGGRPLMEVLQKRQSMRNIDNREIPVQTLSNLLWAGFGINRPESGKRTAPSAVNAQEIDIYVAMQKGLYIYKPKTHTLNPLIFKDMRTIANESPTVLNAPVLLIYVADYSKMPKFNQEIRDFFSAVDTGFISQNVYLFCASEGLATVVMGSFNRDVLTKEMNLKKEQKIILIQPVGYPKQ